RVGCRGRVDEGGRTPKRTVGQHRPTAQGQREVSACQNAIGLADRTGKAQLELAADGGLVQDYGGSDCRDVEGELENGASVTEAAGECRAVKGTVVCHQQGRRRLRPVSSGPCEAVQDRVSAAIGVQAKGCPYIGGAAKPRRPVQAALGTLDEAREGFAPIAVAQEVVHHGVTGSILVQTVHGAEIISPAKIRRPVKHAVGRFHQSSQRGPSVITLRPRETVQNGVAEAVRVQPEENAQTVGPAVVSRSVQRAVAPQYQAGERETALRASKTD